MTSSDYERTDEREQASPLDPDPAAPGVSDEAADTVGVPAGSADPAGGSDFVDGAEIGDSPEAGSRDTYTTGYPDDADTRD